MGWKDGIARTTYLTLRAEVVAARWVGMSMLSTSRSFGLYRRIFFEGRTAQEVLDTVRNEVVVDIGCGFTPYFSDSMFQTCEAEGIAFYGVDPVLAEGMRSPWYSRTVAHLAGSFGRYLQHPPGQERMLGVYADAIPLETACVDRILASMSLFIWVDDEEVLAGIFTEFARLLRVGGQVHIYPHPPWNHLSCKNPRLHRAFDAFDITQAFVITGNPVAAPPAYRTIFTKR